MFDTSGLMHHGLSHPLALPGVICHHTGHREPLGKIDVEYMILIVCCSDICYQRLSFELAIYGQESFFLMYQIDNTPSVQPS
jgi:hypothetical protein